MQAILFIVAVVLLGVAAAIHRSIVIAAAALALLAYAWPALAALA